MMRKSILKHTITVQRIITKRINVDITKDRDTEIRMSFPKARTIKDEYKVIE